MSHNFPPNSATCPRGLVLQNCKYEFSSHAIRRRWRHAGFFKPTPFRSNRRAKFTFALLHKLCNVRVCGHRSEYDCSLFHGTPTTDTIYSLINSLLVYIYAVSTEEIIHEWKGNMFMNDANGMPGCSASCAWKRPWINTINLRCNSRYTSHIPTRYLKNTDRVSVDGIYTK